MPSSSAESEGPPTGGLPLFPLGTVLFPGLVLPLAVFEERYRALVRDVTAGAGDGPREFGVVAIERGWEVDRHDDFWVGRAVPGRPTDSAALSLHEVGCSAEIRQITEHADGRFDLVTVGRRRFQILRVETRAGPYLTAEVRFLAEAEGAPGEADRLVPGLLELFQRYLRLLRPDQVGEQVPDEAAILSHLIAATVALPLPERQALLAAPDIASRLRAERRLLHREVTLLHRVRALPVPLPEFAVASSPN
ncbi:MAG: LON peptidase substrate-binding domain-containing protein [Micromonosporaceae bacterium]|nr:LON peptidase substrate-binding domain-containing protein [Micromonosporaceae bacterium]